MAKWVLDWHSVLEYPTLGFHAEPGDILDAVYAPDARWSQNADQLAAETVYRFAIGGDPDYIEPTDGHVLTWDATSNRYVPTAPGAVGLTSVDAFVGDKIANDPASDSRAAVDARVSAQVDPVVTSINARQKLLTPAATAAENRAALNAALEAAATDGAPIALRGAFPVSGAPVAPSGAVHIDATEATFTQADDLTPILTLPSGSRLHGGEFVGKGTDWVNTSSVYAANAVQLASGASDVTLYGVKGSGLAGAGVYAATAVSGIRLIHCDFEGVGSAVIPANTGQYSGAFVINTNGSSDIAVVGGTYRGFAQGLHGGTVDDLFIGGGVTLSAAGQHAIYYGPLQSAVISGFIIESAGLEGIKTQITPGTAGEMTTQLVIGQGVIRGINSHAVHLANTESPYATQARRTIISDLVVDHAAGQGGDTVLLEYASGVNVHDVISSDARRVVSAINSTGLDVHHVRGTGYSQSGISLNEVTDSTFDQIRLIDGSTANNVNEEWGIHVNGATSANLRFTNSRITDSLGNAAFLVRVLAGDLATMSFSGLSGSGATSHGWRSHVSTATQLWLGNDLQGTSGEFFNTPANAAAIADTSGAALATLEAEVNKLKARLRTTGQIN